MLFCCVLIFFEASTVQRMWTINSLYDACSAILAEVANPLSKLGYTRCCRVPGAKNPCALSLVVANFGSHLTAEH